MFFQLEVGEMEIDEMLAWIRVQNLCIVGWIVIEEEQLNKINLTFEKKTCDRLKSMWIWNLLLVIN
jgi:hypothetical protein